MLPLHHSLHDKIPFAIRQHKVITLRGFKNNEINTTDPIYTLKGIKENIKSEAFFFLKSLVEHMLKVPMISSTIFLYTCFLFFMFNGKKGQDRNELMFVKRLRLWPGFMHSNSKCMNWKETVSKCMKGTFFRLFLLLLLRIIWDIHSNVTTPEYYCYWALKKLIVIERSKQRR